MSDRICRIRHAKSLNYCARGMRAFFKEHGLNYLQFVREGLTPEELLATEDEMAIRVVKVALAERDR